MNTKFLLLAVACLFFSAPAFLPADMMKDQPVVAVDKMKSDEAITKAVKDAFAADKDLGKFASNVDVKTDKGVATLSGSVDNTKTKLQFETVARAVPGVAKIVNSIEVKPLLK